MRRRWPTPHEAALFAGRPGMPERRLALDLRQAGVYLFHNGPERKLYIDGRLEVPSRQTFQTFVRLSSLLREGRPGWAEAVERTGRPADPARPCRRLRRRGDLAGRSRVAVRFLRSDRFRFRRQIARASRVASHRLILQAATFTTRSGGTFPQSLSGSVKLGNHQAGVRTGPSASPGLAVEFACFTHAPGRGQVATGSRGCRLWRYGQRRRQPASGTCSDTAAGTWRPT